MHARIFSVLVLLFLMQLPSTIGAQSLVRSRPPECRCQFEMDGIPVKKIQQVQTDIGPVDYYSFVLEGKESGSFLTTVVSFADYPEDALSLDSANFQQEFFQTSIEQAVDQLSGVLIYQSEIEEASVPGRLYRIDYGDGMTVKSKVYLDGRRFYLLQAFYLRDKEKGHAADRFLQSFQLLGN